MTKQYYVQDYIPIKDVKNGIIETTDGRFVKIIEVFPVSFMLDSKEERSAKITAFANWLKIAPVKVQFKIITVKADVGDYTKAVEKSLTEKCATLGKDYINLVNETVKNEAIKRRFFIVFEYVPVKRTVNTFISAVAELCTAAENAKTYLASCGNQVRFVADAEYFTMEFLYLFFNRKTSQDETLKQRTERVILDVMKRHNKVFGVDDIPEISAVNFVAPKGLDFTNSDYFIMDGTYYSVEYIKGNGYPVAVKGGWLSGLLTAGEGIDVDVFIERENRAKAIDKVARKIRLNKTKIKGMQDTNTDYEELSNSIESGYYIKKGLAESEDLFYLSVFITVSAKTLKDLLWKKRAVTETLKASDFFVSECKFCQEDAFSSVLPFNKISDVLKKKTQRNVLTSGAASAYMLTGYDTADENGIVLGINQIDGSLYNIDLFDERKHKNANLNIIGTSGAGKTFTMQLLAERMRFTGTVCYIIAPIKGYEFRSMCDALGGEFIRIAAGSDNYINVMDIRAEKIDGYNNSISRLSVKIQQLIIFFSLIVKDISAEEEQVLDEVLTETYKSYGITMDNKSLFESDGNLRIMPKLSDVYERLQGKPYSERLVSGLKRFVQGSFSAFNHCTNIDANSKFVVIDLSELDGKMLPVGMMVALDFIWDKIRSDKNLRKAIFIDEIWELIGATSSRLAAEFCLTVFKTIRGYGGAAIAATQDLSDFFSLDDGKYGRAIINNSHSKLILNLEPDEAKSVRSVLDLTESEIKNVMGFGRGEALVCSGSVKIPVRIKASGKETEIITSDVHYKAASGENVCLLCGKDMGETEHGKQYCSDCENHYGYR